MRYIFIALLFFCHINKIIGNTAVAIKYDSTIITQIKPIPQTENEIFDKVELDFAKNVPLENSGFWDRFKRWISELIFGNDKNNTKYNSIKIIYWILIALGVVVIIWALTKINFTRYFKSSVKTNSFNFTDIEEDISGINFTEKINDAINNSNYRLAIRWQYLKQLNTLNQKSLITWQPYKTNFDYSKELQNTKYNSSFKDISKIYDYAWYGQYAITSLNYKDIEKQFLSFENINV